MTLGEVETPAAVVDLAVADRNLRRAQEAADRAGVALRPHVKTHKLPRLALRQVELGAVGITCQKLGEAEVMAAAGLEDILVTYNLLGAAKLDRLAALHDRVRVAVGADGPEVVAGYAARFRDPAHPLRVVVELDAGAGRCGVAGAAEAVALARLIAAEPGLAFEGVFTYPPRQAAEATVARLRAVRDALRAAGLPPRVVSNGGTPDLGPALPLEAGLVTEHRPGTYVYNDRMQVAWGHGTDADCALTVLATVVSRPAPGRAILDAGSKALSSDPAPVPGFGLLREHPEAVIVALNEEHAIVDVSACPAPPKVGDRVRVVPNHACVVVNLFDAVHLLHADGRAEAAPVAARGRLS